MIHDSRKALRKTMRQTRRNIPESFQIRYAKRVLLHCRFWPTFRHARRIGFYWPVQGELSPLPLMHLARRHGKTCLMPVIQAWPTNRLRFGVVHSTERLVRHRWGFHEPRGRKLFDVATLDMLIMPLTAFDTNGHRLGMGGGFYDRTLAHKRYRNPLKAGLAYDFQHAPGLAANAWDVALDVVLTPDRLIRCNARRYP